MHREKKNIIELTRISAADHKRSEHLPLAVVADNVRSMHNTGSIFRTADAFDFEKVWLCGITGTPPHPEISKTALGAEDSVEWQHSDSTKGCIEELKRDGWKICVLEQVHHSIPLNSFKIEKGEKYAIVAGNEVEGVSAEVVDMADYVIEIPQCGAKHSLNVSVSCGIAMWHFFWQYTSKA